MVDGVTLSEIVCVDGSEGQIGAENGLLSVKESVGIPESVAVAYFFFTYPYNGDKW